MFATFYYAPLKEYTSNGERIYNEQGDSARFGTSFVLGALGLLLIGLWLSRADNTLLVKFAMILAVIGQIGTGYMRHGLFFRWFTEDDIAGVQFFVLILWLISIVLVLIEWRRSSKERSYYEETPYLERKPFSRYVKYEILERQQNRCAMCNDKLFYPHFDHIDGNRSNNKLTNCQALCPNCHELKTRRDQRNKRNN